MCTFTLNKGCDRGTSAKFHVDHCENFCGVKRDLGFWTVSEGVQSSFVSINSTAKIIHLCAVRLNSGYDRRTYANSLVV